MMAPTRGMLGRRATGRGTARCRAPRGRRQRMDTPVLLYGANGFTGTLIAHLAVQRGLHPILAGRNAAQLAALAATLNLPYQVCPLEDASALDRALHAV